MRVRILVVLLIWTIPFSANAAEVWVGGSPWNYSGKQNDEFCDSVCAEVDSRTSYIFELTLLSGEYTDNARSMLYLGWARGKDSDGFGSYTFVGGGIDARPFPDRYDKFRIQVSVEFGRETIQHSEELRFRLGLLYAPNESWLVGWCHRSTGRKLARLGGKGRNDAIEGVCLSYRVVE